LEKKIFVSGIEIFICLPATNWKPIESKRKELTEKEWRQKEKEDKK